MAADGGRFARRDGLRAGAALTLSVAGLRARVEASPQPVRATNGRAKSCIVLFLTGGPPQHESWDPKPEAPAEVRGDFSTIATVTPGLNIGELMPRTALWTDRIAILRAMSTFDNAHSSSGYWMLTGRPHAPLNTENAPPGRPNDWPSVAAVARKLFPDTDGMPSSIRLPEEIWNDGRLVWPGQDAGWLGRAADPWLMTCEPSQPNFRVPDVSLPAEVPSPRLVRRQELLAAMNDRPVDLAVGTRRWGGLGTQAFDLLQNSSARKAFDLSTESDATRDRYGRTRFGQSTLLARKLVEAGVSFVQVNWTREANEPAGAPVWDTHHGHSQRLKHDLMPAIDLSYTALLQDLHDRGLLDQTLVVWAGEFGRTPRMNGRAGRDHWGAVFSVAVAGGGVKGGAVYGASDKLGAFPASGRLEPQDLWATIYHQLGIDPGREIHDQVGRPQTISTGRVVTEILS